MIWERRDFGAGDIIILSEVTKVTLFHQRCSYHADDQRITNFSKLKMDTKALEVASRQVDRVKREGGVEIEN